MDPEAQAAAQLAKREATRAKMAILRAEIDATPPEVRAARRAELARMKEAIVAARAAQAAAVTPQ